MIQISIKKQKQVTNQASFPTMEEAQNWLAKHKGMGTFGAEAVYAKEPVVLSPAVYEDQQVLVKEAVTEEQELLNEEGLSFDPPQFQTVEISPAEYESQQVLVSPEVLEMEQILVKEAVTEEQELLDEQGESFDPPQFETVEVEPAEYKEQPKLVDVLVSPAEYQVEIKDISAQIERKEAISKKMELGKKARSACDSVLDLISGYNLDRELTVEQISGMQSAFAPIESALRSGRPSLAKSLISEVEPDEVIVTEEMKSLALELLSDY